MQNKNYKKASNMAFLSAICFIFIILSSLIFNGESSKLGLVLPEYFSVMYRMFLMYTIAYLPAPEWAKTSGYMWLFIDSAISIATANGLSGDIALQLRLGIHLASGMWTIPTSWRAGGVLRWIGILFGGTTIGYSIVAPFVPESLFAIPTMLLPIWIIMIGFKLRKMMHLNIN